MLSLAAPEVRHMQQMHSAASFWRSFILLCYMDGLALTRVLRWRSSGGTSNTLPELPDEPQGYDRAEGA